MLKSAIAVLRFSNSLDVFKSKIIIHSWLVKLFQILTAMQFSYLAIFGKCCSMLVADYKKLSAKKSNETIQYIDCITLGCPMTNNRRLPPSTKFRQGQPSIPHLNHFRTHYLVLLVEIDFTNFIRGFV